jgi:tetratricopeptide (TPR) repeat protein
MQSKCVLLLATLLVLSVAMPLRADYTADRRAAQRLVNEGKHEQALEAWLKLAESAANEAQKSDSLDNASISASRLKKWDQATELAKSIPTANRSRVAQMRVLVDQAKWPEVAAMGKDLDATGWPEALAGEALLLRGQAHYRLREGEAAEADFARSLDLLGEGYIRSNANLLRGDNARELLKDLDKALAAYQELTKLEQQRDRYGWLLYTSLTRAADVQRQLKRYDDAQATLNLVDVNAMKNNHWAYLLRIAQAELWTDRGEPDKARAVYEQTLATPGLSDAQKSAVQKRIDALPPKAP